MAGAARTMRRPPASAGNLPDWLAPDLDIVWIGVNPSLPAAHAGFPFANPRNRFWPALNASRLPHAPLEPSVAAMDVLLERDRIGCTDLVKRPSRGEADLSVEERRAGAARLTALVERYRPRILWFHGRTPFEHYARHALGVRPPRGFGLLAHAPHGAPCFVTPNPSPANAAFSLEALIEWYDRLAALREATARAARP